MFLENKPCCTVLNPQHACAHTHIHICAHTHTHTHTHTYVRAHTHTYIYAHTHKMDTRQVAVIMYKSTRKLGGSVFRLVFKVWCEGEALRSAGSEFQTVGVM